MSKTFKALQRAARQRFEKSNSVEESFPQRVEQDTKIRPLHRAEATDDVAEHSVELVEAVEMEAPGPAPRGKPAPGADSSEGLPADKGEDRNAISGPGGENSVPEQRRPPTSHPWMPKDSSATAPPVHLSGQHDPLLQQILEEGLGPAGPASGIHIENDGWVRGRLDTRRIAALLERFALLHVLKQDTRNWYWFWGVKGDAEDLAQQSGLPLDLEAD